MEELVKKGFRGAERNRASRESCSYGDESERSALPGSSRGTGLPLLNSS